MATAVDDGARFSSFFDSLETQKTLLTTCTEQWRKLSTHFSSLQQSLDSKTQTLDSKIQTLDSETKETLESIQKRENSISEDESSAISRVEEQKQASLAEFEKSVTPNADLSETLISHCRKMDSAGLLKFLMSKRKDSAAPATLKPVIDSAIQESVDPALLVLDAVDEFIKTQKVAKTGISDRRWACGLLLAALVPAEEKVPVFAAKVVEKAVAVAEAWKEKIDSEGANWPGHSEATMFLQLVVGFGLRSKFDEEFLRKLVLEYPSRRDMPKIAAKLGFGEKMGDIINELVKNGKEIDAVYFASECGLFERFPPVPLLKDHLKNSRRNFTAILKNGHHSAGATEEANTLELNSLKNIIKCIEDQKLESQFGLESLKKRFAQLEKQKTERKKSAAANKRARGSSGPSAFRPSKAGRNSNPYPTYGGLRNQYTAVSPVGAAYSGSYKYPGQSVYDASPAAAYTPPYGSRSQNYSYPPEDLGVAGARLGGSYVAHTSYGAGYSSLYP